MKAHLSNYAFLRNFNVFLKDFDTSEPDRLEITTNDHWVAVHPAILTVVAALGLNLRPEQISFDEITARSGYYLDRMGLFTLLNKPSPFNISYHEAAGRFIPLTQIQNQAEQSRFISEMVPLLHLDPKKADAIKYTIGELVRNVLEHANAPNGAIVAAQYSQKSNVIRLGICDTGIGVRNSLAPTWQGHVHDDLSAIKWALVPGVSGTTMREGGTAENAGAGLFFVKSISMLTRDYFVVYSGRGVYRLLKRRPDVKTVRLHADPDEDEHTEVHDAPFLPGTLVGIDISVDKIEEFAALLEAIRGAYSSAIQARRKARYKRPRFI